MKKYLKLTMLFMLIAIAVASTASLGVFDSFASAATPAAERTIHMPNYCQAGDNLRGKTVYCEDNTLDSATLEFTGIPEFTGNIYNAEEKYNAGPLVWSFKDNRTDFVGYWKEGSQTKLMFNGIFEPTETFQFMVGDVSTYTFPDDKDYILEKNYVHRLYYNVTTKKVPFTNLTPLKGYDMTLHNNILGPDYRVDSSNAPDMSKATAVYACYSEDFSENTFEINGVSISVGIQGGMATENGYVLHLWDTTRTHFVNFVYDETYPNAGGSGYLIFFEEVENLQGYQYDEGIAHVVIDDAPAIAYAKGGKLNETEPQKDGFKFVGYKTADGEVFDETAALSSDVVLTSEFEALAVDVTFETEVPSSVKVNIGDVVAKPANPTPATGYHFVEWCTDEALTIAYDFATPVTAAMSLYPKFEINSYAVTFETETPSSVSVNHGAAVAKPANPTPATGYHFVEWCTDEALTTAYDFATPVTGPMSLYPKFAINSYAVTFETETPSSVSVNHGATVVKPANPTAATGYHFVEWCTDEALTTAYDFATPVTAAMSLYPKFEINSYAVTFELAEDIIVNINHGSKLAVPTAPTPATGYHFVEWCSDEALTTAYDFDSAVTSAMSLYPKFEINSYAVTFELAEDVIVNINHGSKLAVPTAPTPATGYHFVEWCSDEALTTAYDFATPVTAVMSLYPKFEINVYTISMDVEGKKADLSVNYGTKAALPDAPTKDGYNFIGWKNVVGEVFDFSKEVYGDVELTAEFEPTAKTVFVDWMKPNHTWLAPTVLAAIAISVFVILAVKRK